MRACVRVCLCVGVDRAHASLKATAITNGPLVAFPRGMAEPYPQSRQLTCIRLLGSAAVAVVLLVVCGGEQWWWWGGLTLTAQPSKVGLVEGICFDKSAKQQYVITFHATLITSA